MVEVFKYKYQLGYRHFLEVIDGKTTGAVRASIGPVTTFADVYRFWEFARGFRDTGGRDAGHIETWGEFKIP